MVLTPPRIGPGESPGGSFRKVRDAEQLRRRVAETSDPEAASALGWLLWSDGAEADEDEAVQAFALAMAMAVDVGEVPAPLSPVSRTPLPSTPPACSNGRW